MGIFDGLRGGQGELADLQAQYETAAQRAEQDRLAKEEHARQMMGARPGAILGSSYQAQTATGQNLLMQAYNQAKMAQQREIEEFDPNKHEAWTMSMSALVNLWRAKFLDEWVIVRTHEMEPFWQQAWSRLSGADKFEESPGRWHRLKEDA